MSIIKSEWMGGKHLGRIVENTTSYSNRFDKKEIKNNTFMFKDDSSKEEALLNALKYQEEMSIKFGKTKNKYRYVTENDNEYLEVQLNNDYILKCEKQNLDIIMNSLWRVQKGNSINYAYTQNPINGTHYFHKLAFPEYDKVYHINYNGLDNRMINIREYTKNDNKNKKISGIVFEEKNDIEYWILHWTDINDIKQIQIFSIKDYENKEMAYKKAIEKMNEEKKKIHINNENVIKKYKIEEKIPEKLIECNIQWENGKNQYRIRKDLLNPYVEVKFIKNKVILIMKCDLDKISLIIDKKWLPVKGKNKKVFYVSTSTNKGEKSFFHNIAYPEFKQVDHINRDGLDNRKENLREGIGRVNASNKNIQNNNKTGVTGVYYEGHQTKERYRAQWIDIHGNRKSKSFSVNEYGEEAFKLAVKTRTENHTETLKSLNMLNNNS